MKIIIAEDHQLFADGLERLLNDEPGQYHVINKVQNGKDLLDAVLIYVPDLLLVDINMPLMNGFEAAKKIKSLYPDLKIIFVSMNPDPLLIYKAQRANFEGFVPKDISIDRLKKVIKEVFSGGKVYITATINEQQKKTGTTFKINPLSPRQIQIVNLVRNGVSANKEIGMVLDISTFTVETHLKNIYQILKIKNKVELIRYASTNWLD